jgi:hypothetical protein
MTKVLVVGGEAAPPEMLTPEAVAAMRSACDCDSGLPGSCSQEKAQRASARELALKHAICLMECIERSLRTACTV